MIDLETIASEEKIILFEEKKQENFNPFAKEDYKISKYEIFKENAKNFFAKPAQYLNKKISNALKNIFMPYL